MILSREEFVRKYLPQLSELLLSRRWFAGKSREVVSIEIKGWGTSTAEPRFYLPILSVRYTDGGDELYFYPFKITGKEGPEDVAGNIEFIHTMVSLITTGDSLSLSNGEIRGYPDSDIKEKIKVGNVRIVSSEQSNTSTVIENSYIFKIIRKLNPGINPDYEIPHYLTSKGFRWTPQVMGKLQIILQGQSYHLGTLSKFIAGSVDAWGHFIRQARELILSPETEDSGIALNELRGSFSKLGMVTSEMHNTLSQDSENADFKPEPITKADEESYVRSYTELLHKVCAELKIQVKNSTRLSGKAILILDSENELAAYLKQSTGFLSDALYKTRIHGDYHLGQVLWRDGNFYIIDFEGEPMRPMEYRRRKFSPLKDVAGMLRSIDYLVETAGKNLLDESQVTETKDSLREELSRSFLDSYIAASDTSKQFLPDSQNKLKATLLLFEIEKVLYEIDYELNNRIDFAEIPIDSLIRYLKSSVTNKQN